MGIHKLNSSFFGILPRKTRASKRTKQACHSCSASKQRCDGKVPCARCQSRDIQCSYSTPEATQVRIKLPGLFACSISNSVEAVERAVSRRSGRGRGTKSTHSFGLRCTVLYSIPRLFGTVLWQRDSVAAFANWKRAVIMLNLRYGHRPTRRDVFFGYQSQY